MPFSKLEILCLACFPFLDVTLVIVAAEVNQEYAESCSLSPINHKLNSQLVHFHIDCPEPLLKEDISTRYTYVYCLDIILGQILCAWLRILHIHKSWQALDCKCRLKLTLFALHTFTTEWLSQIFALSISPVS